MNENLYSNRNLKQGYRDWLNAEVSDFTNPLAVTLTFPESDGFSVSRKFAVKKLTKLHHQLSKWMYKNAYTRFKKMTRLVTFLEGNEDANSIHFHSLMDCDYKMKTDVTRKIDNWWSGITHTQSVTDDGWIDYISKSSSKLEYSDSFIAECSTI